MANENDQPTPAEATDPAQPANPSRRRWGAAALATVAAAFGYTAAKTETGQKIIKSTAQQGQKIMDAAPWNDHSDRRPSLYTQQEEIQKNLDAQDLTKRSNPQIEPEQKKIQADIKATMDANPNNRYQPPTPTSKK